MRRRYRIERNTGVTAVLWGDSIAIQSVVRLSCSLVARWSPTSCRCFTPPPPMPLSIAPRLCHSRSPPLQRLRFLRLPAAMFFRFFHFLSFLLLSIWNRHSRFPAVMCSVRCTRTSLSRTTRSCVLPTSTGPSSRCVDIIGVQRYEPFRLMVLTTTLPDKFFFFRYKIWCVRVCRDTVYIV